MTMRPIVYLSRSVPWTTGSKREGAVGYMAVLVYSVTVMAAKHSAQTTRVILSGFIWCPRSLVRMGHAGWGNRPFYRVLLNAHQAARQGTCFINLAHIRINVRLWKNRTTKQGGSDHRASRSIYLEIGRINLAFI